MIFNTTDQELNPYKPPLLQENRRTIGWHACVAPGVFVSWTLGTTWYSLAYEFTREHPNGWPVIIGSFLVSTGLGIYSRSLLWPSLCCFVPILIMGLFALGIFGWSFSQVYITIPLGIALSLVVLLISFVSHKRAVVLK